MGYQPLSGVRTDAVEAGEIARGCLESGVTEGKPGGGCVWGSFFGFAMEAKRDRVVAGYRRGRIEPEELTHNAGVNEGQLR